MHMHVDDGTHLYPLVGVAQAISDKSTTWLPSHGCGLARSQETKTRLALAFLILMSVTCCLPSRGQAGGAFVVAPTAACICMCYNVAYQRHVSLRFRFREGTAERRNEGKRRRETARWETQSKLFSSQQLDIYRATVATMRINTHMWYICRNREGGVIGRQDACGHPVASPAAPHP